MECGFLKPQKTADDETLKFAGEIKLGSSINGDVMLYTNPRAESEGASEKTPDYIVGYRPYGWKGGARNQGSAWLKHSDSAADFLSITMDDPRWDKPINLAAFADKKGGFSVVWSRPRRVDHAVM
jgi:uncharacterized protein (DUF736 family)